MPACSHIGSDLPTTAFRLWFIRPYEQFLRLVLFWFRSQMPYGRYFDCRVRNLHIWRKLDLFYSLFPSDRINRNEDGRPLLYDMGDYPFLCLTQDRKRTVSIRLQFFSIHFLRIHLFSDQPFLLRSRVKHRNDRVETDQEQQGKNSGGNSYPATDPPEGKTRMPGHLRLDLFPAFHIDG